MLYKLSSIVFLACLANAVVVAQPYNSNTRKAAVDSIAKFITNNYVFADKGKQIAEHLLQQEAKGVFNKLQNWKQFDSAATRILRAFSGDGHLYTGIDANIVKQLRRPQINDPHDNEPIVDDRESNYGFVEVRILPGNMGYIQLKKININRKSLPLLYAAMTFVSSTKALVLDLRNNGGGGSDTGAVVQSFFLRPDVPLLQFHQRSGEQVIERTVGWLREPVYTPPLYILVNGGTASAAEAIAFSLQHHQRAVIVGQKSAGAANMNTWYPVNDSLYVSVSTASPTIPGTRLTWEATGITPDIKTEPGKEMEAIANHIESSN